MIYVGEPISKVVVLTLEDGEVFSEPDTVVFAVLQPGATTVDTYTYGTDDEVTKVGAGRYSIAVTATTVGIAQVQVTATWNSPAWVVIKRDQVTVQDAL